MSTFDLLQSNLLSPVVLAFALGMLATLLRSDLKVPEDLYSALTIYLLLAIGLKGGTELARTGIAQILIPLGLTLLLGFLTPLSAFTLARWPGGLSRVDAGALAAHYGSVSVVTFIAVTTFLTSLEVPFEGFMAALVAVLEVPAIVVGLLLAGTAGAKSAAAETSLWRLSGRVLVSKSVLLLLGGLTIGYASGPEGVATVAPFFVAPFKGVLVLFLLELGMVTARRFRDLPNAATFLLLFGTLVPVLHGTLGVLLGSWAGLSLGGATVLGTLAASASYIAAPAAVRIALPEANPALYLTSALAITFPFNLIFGIPLYYALARFWMTGG